MESGVPKPKAKIELKTIGLKDTAAILSVSTATVRNWIKSGKIKPIKQGRSTVFLEHEILNLKNEIETGVSQRLKSRRNKRAVAGNYIPTEYVSSQEYIRITEKVLEILHESSREIAPNLVLMEVALKLLHNRGFICYPSDSQGKSLLELAREGYLSLESFSEIRELYDFTQELSEEDLKVLLKISDLDIGFIPGEDLLGLVYMSLSNLGTRKNKGSYYTPTTIVNSLVNKSLKLIDHVAFPKIIDPCCGSGNFLIKIFLELRSMLLARGFKLEEIESELLKNCIYGFDVDPIAVALVKINLKLLIEGSNRNLNIGNIKCLNTLDNYGGLFEEEPKNYDLVIGNPPWGYSFSQKEINQLKQRFITAQASLESFCLFLEYGVSVLKDTGILSFVLPDSLLNVQIHATTRGLLLEKTNIIHIELLGAQFSKVFTPTITLIAERTAEPSEKHETLIHIEEETYSIAQRRFQENELFIFNVKASNREGNIMEHMKSLDQVMFLKGQADFALGIVTGNNNELLLSHNTGGSEPILKGNDIFKYDFKLGENYIEFRPEVFQQVAPESTYRAPEKLIYRFINENLVFAYDNQGHVLLNSANLVIPRIPGYSIKYILAILNSRAAQFFHAYSFSSIKVLRRHIESIPIPPCNPETQESIVNFVDQLLETNMDDYAIREDLYEKIDALVMGLYLLNDDQKRIIKEKCDKVKYLLY